MIWNLDPPKKPRTPAAPFHPKCCLVTISELQGRIQQHIACGRLEEAKTLHAAVTKVIYQPTDLSDPPQ